MTKRTWPAVLLAASLSVFAARDALACGEALLDDSEAVAKMKEAEAALEQGDVLHARALAAEVERDSDEVPVARTMRIRTLSFVRDPKASSERVDDAVIDLEKLATKYNDDTQLREAWGEALARAGDAKRAYEILATPEERDVISSAWAHAALGRSARTIGDGRLANLGFSRCETTATDPKICRGEYPAPPLFRTKMWVLIASALVFLFGLALRKTARFAPWRDHMPRLYVSVIGIAALVPFVFPRATTASVAAAASAVAFVLLLQPRLFFRAVKNGRVPGLALRPMTEDDSALPMLGFFFGPGFGATLERTVDSPTYRTTARDALLRVGRLPRALSRWRVFGPVALGALVVLAAATALGVTFVPRQIQRAISASISQY